MISVMMLSLLIVAAVVVLFYLFNESKLEPDSPTIAAMEAHTEAVEARRKAEQEYESRSVPAPREEPRGASAAEACEEPAELPRTGKRYDVPDYEYREMLEETGGNYVLPQWILNFFSSSDICHTLDSSDNVIAIVKLNDPKSAESGIVDISTECDMTTQTVALKLCFGEGAVAEVFKTKFYLFERGDLFEISRLAHQTDIRIDVLTRGADYSLEYACTLRAGLPQEVATQIKSVLTRIPA